MDVRSDPIDSEVSFCEAVWCAIEDARAQRLRELVLCDPHFGFWPLSQERVLSALTAFAKLPGRKLVLVAQRYDHLRRRHPRFVRWRNDWSHAVTPLCLHDHAANDLPSLLLADRSHGVLLKNAEAWEGRWVSDRATLQVLHEQARGWIGTAHPDLPVSLTGL